MDRDNVRRTRPRVTRQTAPEPVKQTVEESSEEECENNSNLNSEMSVSGRAKNQDMNVDNVSRSSSSSPIRGLEGLGLVDPGLDQLQNKENNGNVSVGEKTLQSTSRVDEQEIPTRNLPAVNVPEKIVLCIDTSEDPDYLPFKVGKETMYPPLYMIKRIVEIFVYSKSTINKCHEFALVVLHDSKVSWVRNYTNDRRVLLRELEKLTPSPQSTSFDLTELFDVIIDNMPLPASVPDPAINTPSFVPRVILLYSRSHCMPSFMGGKNAFDFISKCPYFTLDLLYIHEGPSEENMCEEIYAQLSELDVHGYSYSFNVTRNATKLHDHMAKLLAHPLQRPRQKDVKYKFEVA